MIASTLYGRQWSVPLAALCLAAIAGLSALAASLDALGLVLIGIVVLAGVAVAVINPTILLYAYCAAIPLSDALPPGPAGSIGRIAGLTLFVGYLVREPNSLRPIVVPVAGWLYVAWALATSLWAIDPETSFDGWLSLGQLFAVTLLIASLVATNPDIARKGIWAYAMAATLTAIAGVVSALLGADGFLSRATAFGDQSPAGFASIVLPAAILLMGEVTRRQSAGALRVLALGALVTCVLALVVSGTRSAWLGGVAATLIWLAIRRDRGQLLAILAIGLSIALAISSVPELADFVLRRAESSVATGGSGRVDIWAVALGIFASAPILGVGFGNFPQAFTADAIAQVAGADVGSVGRGAHNVLLAALVETGIIGSVLLVGFFGWAIWRSDGNRQATIIRIALVSLIIQGQFLDLLLRKHLWLLLGLALGMAAAKRAGLLHGEMARSRESPGDQEQPVAGLRTPRRPAMPLSRADSV